MDVVLLGDLLNGFDALERLQAHAGFELGIVSFSFGFHFVFVRLGLQPPPDHHNHSLTPGPNSRVRLSGHVVLSRARMPSVILAQTAPPHSQANRCNHSQSSKFRLLEPNHPWKEMVWFSVP